MGVPGAVLLLADDDEDDCSFFQDALNDLSSSRPLNIVHDAQELMTYLQGHLEELSELLLFLDLNMPGKNGMECLAELKSDPTFNQIPVVVITTSSQEEVINRLFNLGAHFYIKKPNEFSHLKVMIDRAIRMIEDSVKPSWSNFIIEV